MTEKIYTFIVDRDFTAARLDKFLSQKLPDLSRVSIQKLIKSGLVLVNDQPCLKSRLKITTGDRLVVRDFPPTKPFPLQGCYIPLNIIYEDEDIIVINKQKGLSVHPGAGEHAPTLVHGLIHYLGSAFLDVTNVSIDPQDSTTIRPGIVHRLDKDTSGLMVCAKTEVALRILAKQFHDKIHTKRNYMALLDGCLIHDQILVESYLIRDPANRLRFKAIPIERGHGLKVKNNSINSGRYAKSRFIVKKRYLDRLTLASITLFTGRTHQIRVHAKQLKCPIVGDLLYHKITELPHSFPKKIRELIKRVSTQLLHAETLGFIHPKSQKEMLFSCAIPKDFQDVINVLEEYNEGNDLLLK